MILGAQKFRFESIVTVLEDRRGWIVGALCLLWMIPGLVAREPWKPEEAYIFGVVYQWLETGDWLVPGLAGEPFLRHPPFYYWTAAIAGKLLSPVFALHDAVRLINVLYGAATFSLMAATVAHLQGRLQAWLGPLVLVGCIGLLQPAHQLVPENAVLLAHALGAYGLATLGAARAPAALSLGCGIGLAFLSRGVISALPLALSALMLPIVLPALRNRQYLRFLLLSFIVALPWLTLWPAALYAHDAHLFHEWWWIQQIGRFRTDLPGAGHGSPAYYLKALSWFAWPVLPFAAYALWLARGEWRSNIAVTMPAMLFATTLVLLSVNHDKREVFALPMLFPLSLLATATVPGLRRGAVNAFFWFGIAFFLFFFAALWFYFAAIDFGVPERAARHMARMEPGYVPGVSLASMVAAAVLTAIWVLTLFNIRRSPARPFVTWAAGAAAFWTALMLLMIGWADNAKSYRPMIASLSHALAGHEGCVSSLSLGESQRALLHYYAGLKTKRVESGNRSDACAYLLVEGTVGEGPLGSPWMLMWEGHRAGDDQERFRLYRQGVAAPPATGGARQ